MSVMGGKDLRGKRVVVVGLGLSGEAACRLARAKGADVLANDARSREQIGEAAAARLEADGIELALGSHAGVDLVGADVVVVSPGVPAIAFLADAERYGANLVSEIELASWFVDAELVAVGGTNGKSTTTELCAALARTTGRPVFAGGNLGVPLAQAVLDNEPGVGGDGIAVVEVSSFQLERVRGFRPRTSILLNVTDDHLDRYASFEAYAIAKGGAFKAQRKDDFAIVPHGDALSARVASLGYGALETIDGPAPASVGVEERPDGPHLVDRVRGVSMPLSALKLAGRHNVTNLAAAWAAIRDLGADVRLFQPAIEAFRGLAHRMVLARELDGVRYYDDSKGTNVGAVVTALGGVTEPKAVLIAGGRDKGGSYGPMIEALASKGRGLVLIGEAAAAIEAAAKARLPALPVVRATSMEDAVRAARELAQAGDAVLLSPACSSYDMFKDYKQRGDLFVAAVHALAPLSSTSSNAPDTKRGAT
jgi:UDP-N-acetylmuramoylalanine--D-glutamate ligase